MPKAIHTKFVDNQTFIIDYFIELSVYAPLRDRLVDQILKNTEVPGFRKGKAPVNLAMEKIDPAKMQATIYQEAIYRYYTEAENLAKEELAKENRIAVQTIASLDPEFTKETEEGFQFRLSLALLPSVNIEPLHSLKVETPSTSEIPDLLSFEDFRVEEEKRFIRTFNQYEETDLAATKESRLKLDIVEEIENDENSKKETKDGVVQLGLDQFPPDFEKELLGLKKDETKEFSLELPFGPNRSLQTIKFVVTCNQVLNPKFTDLEGILSNSEDARKQFENAEAFESFLKDIYEQQSQSAVQDLLRKKIIKEIIKVVPDFAVDEERMLSESNRIFHSMQKQSELEKKELSVVFKETGLPGSDTDVKDADKIEHLVKEYVHSEFKLAGILQYVYHTQVEEKVSEQELNILKKDLKENPTKFGIARNLPDEELENTAFDRIVRSKAFQWIVSKVEANSESKVN